MIDAEALFKFLRPVLKQVFEVAQEQEQKKYRKSKTKNSSYNEADFKLVSSTEGRRRYRSVLIKDPNFAQDIEERLLKLPFILEVEAKPLTGSLLLEYSCSEDEIDAIFELIKEKIAMCNNN